MDFLRRLAPLRDTDATRAVAVLPSRFAGEAPLRAASALPDSPRSLGEGDFAPVREAVTRRAPDLAKAGQRQYLGNLGHARAEPLRPAVALPTLPTRSLAEAPAIAATVARVSGDRQPTGPQSSLATDGQYTAAKPAISLDLHAGPALSSPSRTNPPLSQAVVAQRAQASHDDGPVVHVTIGRIDVVAGTPPPSPPARRSAKAPRTPTVALADYLRAGNGSRR